MWVFLKESFLSIVEHDEREDLLHVRARIEGDIERIFPEADVSETPNADYRFRTSLSRERVAHALKQSAEQIDYTNFKNSVPDPDRKQAYLKVWEAMWEEQRRRRST